LKVLSCVVLELTLTGMFPEDDRFNLWHGGLGRILKQDFPRVFDLLYAISSNQARGYALIPPTYQFPCLRLTLMGEIAEYAVVLTQALIHLGTQGLSRGRYLFVVETAHAVATNEERFLYYRHGEGILGWPNAWSADELFTGEETGREDLSFLRLEFYTPLLLKEDNRPIDRAPHFDLIVRRLLGRISQLAHAIGSGLPYAEEQAVQWQTLAATIELIGVDLTPERVQRRSGRTGQQMVFSGWVGTLDYAGLLSPFLGLLQLGGFLQLGGRTSFGFGAYRSHWARLNEGVQSPSRISNQ
jgi:hypothetical protein